MKNLIYILTIAILSVTACKKEFPEPDSPVGYGVPAVYTNYYILDSTSAVMAKTDMGNDNYWNYITNDTISYDRACIPVFYYGKIIADNCYFTDQVDTFVYPDGSLIISPQERRYYINKLKKVEVFASGYYNGSSNKVEPIKLKISKRGDIGVYTGDKYEGEDLGYGMTIYFTAPPDSSRWYSFTVRIVDDKGNVFTATTDKIFVTK